MRTDRYGPLVEPENQHARRDLPHVGGGSVLAAHVLGASHDESVDRSPRPAGACPRSTSLTAPERDLLDAAADGRAATVLEEDVAEYVASYPGWVLFRPPGPYALVPGRLPQPYAPGTDEGGAPAFPHRNKQPVWPLQRQPNQPGFAPVPGAAAHRAEWQVLGNKPGRREPVRYPIMCSCP